MTALRPYRQALLCAALLALPFGISAQTRANGALDAIREADIKADLFKLAGDSMRGREAGTLDELRASMWLAERARVAGLQPAGDDGTYFQFWNMRRVRQSSGSSVLVDGQPLTMWKDVALSGLVDTTIDAPIVWIDEAAKQGLAPRSTTGALSCASAGPSRYSSSRTPSPTVHSTPSA